jgi:ABC-type glycerol-3-phosphate transport system substrate-binding protein
MKAIGPALAAYEKANPKVKVEIQQVDWNTFQQRVLTSAAGGQLPCVMYTNTQVEAAIAAANVMDTVDTSIITKSELDQMPDVFMADLKDTNGNLIFVPYGGGADQFYIRTDNSAGATVPKTYSQWISFAKATTTLNNGSVQNPGLGWRYNTPGNAWMATEFMALVLAAGGQFLDGDNGPTATKALFDTPAGQVALQFMHDSIWKNNVALPPNKANENSSNPISSFVDGTEGSTFAGPWLPNALATLEGAAGSVKSKWNATYFPPQPDTGGKDVTIISNDGWGVPKACKNPDDAWNFIKAITSKDAEIEFFNTFQATPARKDAMLSSEVVTAFTKNMPGAKNLLSLWTDPTVAQAAVPELDTKYNADIFTVSTTDIEKYLNSETADTSAALSTLASDINRVLKNG